jgi:Ca2+/Na+ antiporter
LTITHFARIGHPKTAIAGIFSGQLFNFALGFGVSLFIQSLDGEYEYNVFDFKGEAFDKISDSIVLLAIAGTMLYIIYVLVIAVKNNGKLAKGEALVGKWYYIVFLVLSCCLALLTDFFRKSECKL